MQRYLSRAVFDSHLDVASVGPNHHANLTIIVRIAMHEYFPDSSFNLADWLGISGARASFQGRDATFEVNNNGVELMLTRWPNDEFDPWCQEYKQKVEHGWHNKLWLVPSGLWEGAISDPENTNVMLVPAVRCCLRIILVNGDPHVNCDVAYLASSRNHRTSTAPLPYMGNRIIHALNIDCFSGGPNRLKADNLDLTPKPVTGQIAALHEMGHYLGLNHVNMGGENEYGDNEFQRDSLMGAGMDIRSAHAWPWKNRLRHHLTLSRSTTWHAVTRRPRLTRVRNYVDSTRGPVGGDDHHGAPNLDGGVARYRGVRNHRGPIGRLS